MELPHCKKAATATCSCHQTSTTTGKRPALDWSRWEDGQSAAVAGDHFTRTAAGRTDTWAGLLSELLLDEARDARHH